MYCMHLRILERAKARFRGGVGRFDKRHTKKQVVWDWKLFFCKAGLVWEAVRKKNRAWKIVFLQSPISSHKTIRGHSTKKCHKGELQTSRISNHLRIWQSYFRVPQILKVLCAWYSWKYDKICSPPWIRAPQILIQWILIQYSSCIHVYPNLRPCSSITPKKVTVACYHHGQRGDHQKCPSYRSLGVRQWCTIPWPVGMSPYSFGKYVAEMNRHL